MSQRDRVLQALKAGPVCGTEFLRMHIPRYAARVLELRQQGHEIMTVPCNDVYHDHQSAQVRYVLVEMDQQRLFA